MLNFKKRPILAILLVILVLAILGLIAFVYKDRLLGKATYFKPTSILPDGQDRFKTNELIIKYKNELSDEEIQDKVAKVNKGKKPSKITRPFKDNPKFASTYVLEFSPSNLPDIPDLVLADLTAGKSKMEYQLEALAGLLREDPSVEYVEKNLILKLDLDPNDPYYASSGSWGQNFADLWGLKKIQSSSAWDVATGSEGVIVAVIDTGADYNHPDLNGNILRDASGKVIGRDFAYSDSDPWDDHGHGTHVAGTIGAVGNNALGVVGINWKVKIMPLKVFDAYGRGDAAKGAAAMIYAADSGAKVINNSWGGEGYSETVHQAVEYARSKNVVVVASAGNDTTDALQKSPAMEPGAITVSAFDYNDQIGSFSNFGEKIDVAAPGVEVLSLKASQNNICGSNNTVGTNYCYLSGTSMAAPHVSGLAALLLAKNPGFGAEQIRQAVRMGADDVGLADWDKNSGYGRINSAKSLGLAAPLEARISSGVKSPDGKTLTFSGTAGGQGFSSYKLAYASGYPSGGKSWQVFKTSSLPVAKNQLGELNIGSLTSNIFTVKLEAVNTSGQSFIDFYFLDRTLLEGWPANPDIVNTYSYYSSPTVADLDSDGNKEVIVGGNYGRSIFVLSSNGASRPGWPKNLINNPNYYADSTQPAVGDINGDNKPEIIFAGFDEDASGNRTGKVFALKSDGSVLPGWPLSFPDAQPKRPTLGDVNGDGKPEIVFGTTTFSRNNVKLYAVSAQGVSLTGFPISFGTSLTIRLALAELTDDKVLEIVAATSDPVRISAFSGQGQALTGWPKSVNAKAISHLAIGDVDGDQKSEVFLNTYNRDAGQINGWKANGTVLPGFPVQMIAPNYGYIQHGPSPVLADIDHNNLPEVLSGPCNRCQYVMAVKANGAPVPGFPAKLTQETTTFGQLVVLDADGDGKLEIIGAGFGRGIYAIRENGQLISDWPYTPRGSSSFYWKDPSTGDLNGDGKLELVMPEDWLIYAWSLPGKLPNDLEWPHNFHDSTLTGRYLKPASSAGPTPTPTPEGP